MMKISLNDKALKQVQQKLKDKRSSTRKLMVKINGIMMDEVEENFAQEGRPKWKPLAKATLKNKKRRGGKILQDTRQLANSISGSVTETQSIVGTNKKYAAIQQKGGEINVASRSEIHVRSRRAKDSPRGKKGTFSGGKKSGQGFTFKAFKIIIPARPYLLISAIGNKKIVDAVNGHFSGV